MNPNQFTRYLSAKKTVDDRALNQHVWARLQAEVAQLDGAITVLEVGAGIGTMIERVLAWELFDPADNRPIRWIALDQDAPNIAALQERLGRQTLPEQWQIEPVTADIYPYLARCDERVDVLIAHAFLDLFDTAVLLPPLLKTIKSNGLFWFTINFDGVTAFEPAIDPVLDTHIEQQYHRTMDGRIIDGKLSGDSQTGRHLLPALQAMGADILAAGSSDWVVMPQKDGAYPDDEAWFLHFIIDTVASALAQDDVITPQQLTYWANMRHAQIDTGSLFYIAHQLDMLGRVPPELAFLSQK